MRTARISPGAVLGACLPLLVACGGGDDDASGTDDTPAPPVEEADEAPVGADDGSAEVGADTSRMSLEQSGVDEVR